MKPPAKPAALFDTASPWYVALLTRTREGWRAGLNISPAMVDAARRRVPHADVLLGDAQTNDLAATFDGRFDAVVSRFGVMFFDDPVAAFANLAEASSRSGGRRFDLVQADGSAIATSGTTPSSTRCALRRSASPSAA